MSTQATQTELKTMTVKNFMISKNFISVHKSVRENENGYPYVTFIDKDNKAENVYFSKSESENVTSGTPIEKGFFDKLQIGETTNEAGEIRMKIVGMSSLRVSIEDLF